MELIMLSFEESRKSDLEFAVGRAHEIAGNLGVAIDDRRPEKNRIEFSCGFDNVDFISKSKEMLIIMMLLRANSIEVVILPQPHTSWLGKKIKYTM
jgi:hypothetical protein